jgi:hypothetical protein
LCLDKRCKFVGKGATGSVFTIVHLKSGETFAWKEVGITPETKDQLKQAAELAMKVESQFVAPLLDNFEEEKEGIFYLVEEFYEDGTLRTLVNELNMSGIQISREVSFILYNLLLFPMC